LSRVFSDRESNQFSHAGEQTGPAQFAPILVPELSEIPRADAVDGRVAILEVGGYGQQVVDLWLELHLEVGRVIFRM
jgi:hypothetical protein